MKEIIRFLLVLCLPIAMATPAIAQTPGISDGIFISVTKTDAEDSQLDKANFGVWGPGYSLWGCQILNNCNEDTWENEYENDKWYVRDAVLDSEENILVLGRLHYLAGNSDWMFVVRIDSSGDIDTSFSGDGAVFTNGDIEPISVDTDDSDNVYVYYFNDSNNDYYVRKYNLSGTYQWERNITSFTSSRDWEAQWFEGFPHGDIVVLDDSVAVCGKAVSSNEEAAVVLLNNSNGTYDTSFSGDGKWHEDIGPSQANSPTHFLSWCEETASGDLVVAGGDLSVTGTAASSTIGIIDGDGSCSSCMMNSTFFNSTGYDWVTDGDMGKDVQGNESAHLMLAKIDNSNFESRIVRLSNFNISGFEDLDSKVSSMNKTFSIAGDSARNYISGKQAYYTQVTAWRHRQLTWSQSTPGSHDTTFDDQYGGYSVFNYDIITPPIYEHCAGLHVGSTEPRTHHTIVLPTSDGHIITVGSHRQKGSCIF